MGTEILEQGRPGPALSYRSDALEGSELHLFFPAPA